MAAGSAATSTSDWKTAPEPWVSLESLVMNWCNKKEYFLCHLILHKDIQKLWQFRFVLFKISWVEFYLIIRRSMIATFVWIHWSEVLSHRWKDQQERSLQGGMSGRQHRPSRYFFSFPHDFQKHLIIVRLDQLDIWTPDPRTVILRRWLLFWCKLEIHLLLVGLVLLVELLLELLPGLRVVGVCQGGHHHQADCQQQHLHLLLLTQLLTGQVLSGRLFIQSFPSRYLPLLAKLIKVRTLFQMCTNMCGLCLALFCGQNFEATSIDICVCQLRPSIPRWVQNFLCVLEASTEQVDSAGGGG